ncbi:D-serine ammonia-lyase [Tatumella sp. UBA2305]|uniref:D-serine ammonia-lyase n=1 Tax=Tatumella sp. UBA2305 TaxID=1947647 RepID=UPI0025FC6238|nr:D-serine ammonia-lyase [Tatumella sp. UBA2305]
MEKTLYGKTLADWQQSLPLLTPLMAGESVVWANPALAPFHEALADIPLTAGDVEAASARLKRFAPLLAQLFPEVAPAQGIIESELVRVPEFAAAMTRRYSLGETPQLWLKKDSHLPISGSVKARGGIYEVLFNAEQLAIRHGLLTVTDDYRRLADETYRQLFSQHKIAVGSTGNLGLSIGIAAARLGFATTVHMSADARQWKKDKLRSHGVTVIEYAGDYGLAVEEGRRQAEADPRCHFIDDENSSTLFLGYAVAGERLKAQLDALQITIDAQHPLCVYLPCGVGGGPGGIAFGLKLAFGDHVHCFFAEPTQSPCMLLGMASGLHEAVSVTDFGISNHTAADGLAVGRPSGFVGRSMQRMISGCYTVPDEELFSLLRLLDSTEHLQLEPSALAGAPGVARITSAGFPDIQLENAIHLIWATGGGMVPAEEMQHYLAVADNGSHNPA